MRKLPKVTWVVGGLQSSSVPWSGPPGRTGFVYNHRRIEEPNFLCDIIKKYIDDGYYVKVETCENLCSSLEDVIDEVLLAFHFEMTENGCVQISFLPKGSWAERDKCPWILLRPSGRLTRHESWIVKASMPVPGAVDD